MRLATKIIHGVGLFMAFNQGIGSAISNLQSNTFATNPNAAFADLLFRETGIVTGASGGTPGINLNQTMISVWSKVGAYFFVKVAMHFVKRFRV